MRSLHESMATEKNHLSTELLIFTSVISVSSVVKITQTELLNAI